MRPDRRPPTRAGRATCPSSLTKPPQRAREASQAFARATVQGLEILAALMEMEGEGIVPRGSVLLLWVSCAGPGGLKNGPR